LTILQQIIEQAAEQSTLEVIAVVAAIAYLVFAIRQDIVCWLFAAISTAIYVWLFVVAKLYMESVLNGFYFAMAIYGYFMWRSVGGNGEGRPVVVWPLNTHVMAIATICILSAANGYLLTLFSDAAFPYVDSLTTWSAIWATFLVARKVLENWWYWLVIDFASVFIYFSRDLELTSALFVIYIVMIPFGLIAWTRSLREQGTLR
jgi:nicotinamide mononucleotide transporter